jgi:hypothetical protein
MSGFRFSLSRAASNDETQLSPTATMFALWRPLPHNTSVPVAPLVAVLPTAAGLVVLLAVWFAGRPSGASVGFPLDDAWIHMVYGRGLLADGYLAYNPGTPATGNTAPLWALCVGVAHALFGRISTEAVVVGVFLLGCIFHLVTIWLVADLTWRLTRHGVTAVGAATILAVSAPMAGAAFSGMEVALCALLLVAAVRALIQQHWWRAGVWLALAATARPEAAAVTVLALALALTVDGSGARTRLRQVLLPLAVPSALAGSALVAYYWTASGRPLPATFYFKHAVGITDLPDRFLTAFTELFNQVPPFIGLIGWLAFAGYIAGRDHSPPDPTPRWKTVAVWPALAGFIYIVANLYVMPPVDPAAFYHLRYVLPAVPLLIVGATVGAEMLAERSTRGRPVFAVAVAAAIASGAITIVPVSARLHNDVRNINEVQRAMGAWLAQSTSQDSWIAASDAGAVRYFSQRPTIDLMGLNTPELYWNATYARDHAVAAIAFMPAWIQPVTAHATKVYAVLHTANYTVTSFPAMATQFILGCPGSGRVPVEFAGVRRFVVYCDGGRLETNPGTAE